MEWGDGRRGGRGKLPIVKKKTKLQAQYIKDNGPTGGRWGNFLSLTDIVPRAFRRLPHPVLLLFTDMESCEPLCANKAKLAEGQTICDAIAVARQGLHRTLRPGSGE